MDARKLRSRNALRAALLSLLEQKAFDHISVRAITATAGIGYATFFRHYPSKEALLNDLASDQITELLNKALPVMYASDSRAAALTLCSYVNERRKLWRALLTGGAAGTMREEFIRQARTIAGKKPSSEGSLPDDLRVVFGVGGTIDILAWWLQNPGDSSIDQIADYLNQLVITPMWEGH